MRLICPECNALYDIADAMIPPEGREVECSACGHVWLQTPAMTAPRTDATSADGARAPETSATSAHENGDQPRSSTMRGLSADLRAAALSDNGTKPVLGAAPVLQRPLPDDVLSILREETARELGARRGSRGDAPAPLPPETALPTPQSPVDPPEEPAVDWPATTVTQPDINDPDESASPAEPEGAAGQAPAVSDDVIAAPRQPDVDPAPPRVPQDASAPDRPAVPRRRVSRDLPDVEMLAATIQTESAPPVAIVHPAAKTRQRSGYRGGLLGAISVAAALAVAYVAGVIWVNSGDAPASVQTLVNGVDHLRAGLHDAASAVLGRKGP